MNDKVIADYVREKRPELLQTPEYFMYALGHTIADAFRPVINALERFASTIDTDGWEIETDEESEDEE